MPYLPGTHQRFSLQHHMHISKAVYSMHYWAHVPEPTGVTGGLPALHPPCPVPAHILRPGQHVVRPAGSRRCIEQPHRLSFPAGKFSFYVPFPSSRPTSCTSTPALSFPSPSSDASLSCPQLGLWWSSLLDHHRHLWGGLKLFKQPLARSVSRLCGLVGQRSQRLSS